jgi:hypothetical protein
LTLFNTVASVDLTRKLTSLPVRSWPRISRGRRCDSLQTTIALLISQALRLPLRCSLVKHTSEAVTTLARIRSQLCPYPGRLRHAAEANVENAPSSQRVICTPATSSFMMQTISNSTPQRQASHVCSSVLVVRQGYLNMASR